MALCSLRLPQAIRTLTPLLGHRTPVLRLCPPSAVESSGILSLSSGTSLQSRPFWSSPVWLSSSSRSYTRTDEEIGPDTILFEGCDYNHWLIVMEFPKDSNPTPEEMVDTYVKTLATGLNISIEEAKLKMYACSTTTYVGFQAVMTEEESEKFRGLPGVVFILPDSYIDPVNKEYGGDKYINGTIIPRPPPVNYGRTSGRYGDRNRNFDRPRYDRQGGPLPNRQGNPPPYARGGPMQGDGGNYQAPQNYPPQQNYSPAGQGPVPNWQGNPPPYARGGPMQGDGGNYQAPQNYPQQQNYGPEGQGSIPMNNRDSAPGVRDAYQGGRWDPRPPNQGNYNQGQQGNYYQHGEQRNYAPPDQMDFRGEGRNYGQGTGAPYGQGYGEGQRFSEADQRNRVQGGEMNHTTPMGYNTNQGRY